MKQREFEGLDWLLVLVDRSHSNAESSDAIKASIQCITGQQGAQIGKAAKKLNDARNCFANLGRGKETRRQQGTTSLLCKLCNLRLSVNFSGRMLFISERAEFLCLWSCAENVSGIARKLKIMEGKNWNDYTSDVNLLWMKIEIICAWKWNRRFDMKETQQRKAHRRLGLIKLLNWNKLWLFGKTSKDINPVARSDSYIVWREKLFSSLFFAAESRK